jgi:hypothetical protein
MFLSKNGVLIKNMNRPQEKRGDRARLQRSILLLAHSKEIISGLFS